MNDYLCRVCGEPGLLSYTRYDRDKPVACRHREHDVRVVIDNRAPEFDPARIEPDSEVGMDEPLGPVLSPGEYDSDDLDRIASSSWWRKPFIIPKAAS